MGHLPGVGLGLGELIEGGFSVGLGLRSGGVRKGFEWVEGCEVGLIVGVGARGKISARTLT